MPDRTREQITDRVLAAVAKATGMPSAKVTLESTWGDLGVSGDFEFLCVTVDIDRALVYGIDPLITKEQAEKELNPAKMKKLTPMKKLVDKVCELCGVS